MKVIQESPEHHFLGFLEKLRHDAKGWVSIHLALSRKFTHAYFLEDPKTIKQKLAQLQAESNDIRKLILKQIDEFSDGLLYQFTDGDIILLVHPRNDSEHANITQTYRNLSRKFNSQLCDFSNLAKELYSYQKLAEARLLASKRIEAYKTLSDHNRISSLALRRQKRGSPIIMLVEDDRFTATYAINILSKDYDVIHARTGEEAILFYIEHAPDMVFHDIHLPGLNGHESLQAIKIADPNAFVIMLSVDAQKDNIVTAAKTGAADFLKKPFSKDRLLQAAQKSPFIKAHIAHSST